jgi:hypothetical protein
MKILFINVITFFIISSCSFSSIQYEAIKNILLIDEKEAQPQKNWIMNWEEQEIELYAINFEDQIIFADSSVKIFFKENQIYKVIGLLPDNSVLDIKSANNELMYISDNVIVSGDYCETVKSIKQPNDDILYIRSCYQESSSRQYNNRFTINSEGMIVNLEFMIHPDYSVLKLRANYTLSYNSTN